VREPVKTSSEDLKYKYSIIGGVLMALNTVQIKTINTYLIKTYKNVSFDSTKKKITVSVDNADRTYRKSILKEIQKFKYTDTQKLIVEDAVYYEFAPDASKAQELLGPTMGIRGAWVAPDPREIKD
jgi:hypothetical protein